MMSQKNFEFGKRALTVIWLLFFALSLALFIVSGVGLALILSLAFGAAFISMRGW